MLIPYLFALNPVLNEFHFLNASVLACNHLDQIFVCPFLKLMTTMASHHPLQELDLIEVVYKHKVDLFVHSLKIMNPNLQSMPVEDNCWVRQLQYMH